MDFFWEEQQSLPSFETAFALLGPAAADYMGVSAAEDISNSSRGSSEQDSDYDGNSVCSSSDAALKNFCDLYSLSSPSSSASSSPTSSYSSSSCEEDEIIHKRRKSNHNNNNNNKHPCQQCSKSFPSHSQLEEHVRYRHSDVRSHQCQQCPKVFKTKSNLNQHSRTHLGATARCDRCDRRFTESGLRYHLLTHKAEKDFSCPLCPKLFVQNKLLQKHLSSCHSAERKYPCPHCPNRFKRKDHLNRHVTDTHSLVEKLFECQVCLGRFQSARRLQQHVKLHKKKVEKEEASQQQQMLLEGEELLLLQDDTELSAFIEDILVSQDMDLF